VVACYVDHKSNIRIERMKEEYDFSKGERGKIFRNDIKLNLPVYLDDDVLEFVEKEINNERANNFKSENNDGQTRY